MNLDLKLLAAIGIDLPDFRQRAGFVPGTTGHTRNRFPGPRRPAGSKLARQAIMGRIGVAVIR